MRFFLKNLYKKMPVWVRRVILLATEQFYRTKMYREESLRKKTAPPTISVKSKKRVLIYHLTALYYAGTEKSLQIIAEGLSREYDVFILHASDVSKPNRKTEVEKFATLIHFTYDSISKSYPHYIESMNPHIKDVISAYDIDLLITAGTGKSEYPFITIQNIPIILINIFGAPCLQSNVKKIIYISKEVLKHSEQYTGHLSRNKAMYIPISTEQTAEGVTSLRKQLSIPDESFIFGRIGRNSDDIFDPIGIEAFDLLTKDEPTAHYVIVSPSPKLIHIVDSRKIPNVHFLPPTGKEEELWSFYFGIDALAHFRFDGETQGLNINESMYAGKPIISHISHLWNAHLEYLDSSFARIAKRNDVAQYLEYMKEFISLKKSDPLVWAKMVQAAKSKTESTFSKKKYQGDMLTIVNEILS